MKFSPIKFVLILLLSLLCSSHLHSQTDSLTKSIKPLRLGIKIGVPNIITANAEYVTPLLDNRIALSMDYMSLSKSIDDTDINYSNFEIGSNIYFNNKGKGFYGGLSYFSFNGEGTFIETEFDDEVYEDGLGIIKFNTINLKLGVKLGRVFYFRFEIGYGLGDIPEQILIKSKSSNRTTYEDIPAIPGISSSGVPSVNFGIGFGLF